MYNLHSLTHTHTNTHTDTYRVEDFKREGGLTMCVWACRKKKVQKYVSIGHTIYIYIYIYIYICHAVYTPASTSRRDMYSLYNHNMHIMFIHKIQLPCSVFARLHISQSITPKA